MDRAKHEEECRRLLKDLGFTDSQNRIRRWNGKLIYPKLAELGHSSVAYATCKCRKEK